MSAVQSLPSFDRHLSQHPRTNTITASCALAVAAPKICNSLPVSITASDYRSFKSKLKSHLFATWHTKQRPCLISTNYGLYKLLADPVVQLAGQQICDSQVTGSSTGWAPLHSGLGQATYTCVLLSPSSIIWYQPMGLITLAWKLTTGLVESNGSVPLGL